MRSGRFAGGGEVVTGGGDVVTGGGEVVGGGEGLGDGLGDGLGLGSGLGEGLGVTEGAGGGGGVGAWSVWPSKDGVGKSLTRMPAVACIMKSCQIPAGIVPPKTADTPSTFSSGISPCG
jgi:hypothetical protein